MFVIVIYAIVGLELFKGQLHATCYKMGMVFSILDAIVGTFQTVRRALISINENTKKGTQVFSNVSHIYGPDAPLLLTDPGDISFDPDGVTFPCDDSFNRSKPENASENKYHGRLCDPDYEMCIGRQACFPVDPDTGLYNKSFPENDDCYHNTTWPGWKGWFEINALL